MNVVELLQKETQSDKNQQQTLVMGILNVTPDSFSDGGSYIDASKAIERAYQLIEDGADILDIGGESTRPTAETVSADEEWKRLRPVLTELCNNSPIPISVDTYKAQVADKALALGVHLINDVWGGRYDPNMVRVIQDAQCGYVWMHNRSEPASESAFDVLVQETLDGVGTFLDAGVSTDRLWIDPGIGFGKTYEQNLTILNRLSEYCQLGHHVLLGTSRKSVIGHTLGLPVDERLEGSLATVSLGVWAGVHIVRVHDVKETVRACRMVEAIRYANANA